MRSTWPPIINSSNSSVHKFLVVNSRKAMVVFKSPAVSLEKILYSYWGNALFNAARTRSVWSRASLDLRVPMVKVFWAGAGAAILNGEAARNTPVNVNVQHRETQPRKVARRKKWAPITGRRSGNRLPPRNYSSCTCRIAQYNYKYTGHGVLRTSILN